MPNASAGCLRPLLGPLRSLQPTRCGMFEACWASLALTPTYVDSALGPPSSKSSAPALFFLCPGNHHRRRSTQMLQSRCLWAADRVILRLLFAAGAWGAHSCEPVLHSATCRSLARLCSTRSRAIRDSQRAMGREYRCAMPTKNGSIQEMVDANLCAASAAGCVVATSLCASSTAMGATNASFMTSPKDHSQYLTWQQHR
jgi:hypothetical protein